MTLNLYTRINGHKELIDTVSTQSGIVGITPATKEGVGHDLYPRVTDIMLSPDSVDVEVKIPNGFSAKFAPDGGQYFIEPTLS